MPQYRVQVILPESSGLPRDAVINTVYFDTDVELLFDDPATNMAEDVRDLWAQRLGGFVSPGSARVMTKVYNMADPKPREPLFTSDIVTIEPGAAPGVQEVALCLSFYADRNVPRRRGRLYFGPFSEAQMHFRPTAQLMSQLGFIAEGLSGIGGPNVQWVQHSPTTGEYHNVTNYWIDNEWDTMRSRQIGADARQSGTVNG